MFPAMQIFALQAKPSESAHAVLSQNFRKDGRLEMNKQKPKIKKK